MVNRMRTGYPHGLNKGLGSKFRDGSRLEQEGSRVQKEGSESNKKYLKKARGHIVRNVVQITRKMMKIKGFLVLFELLSSSSLLSLQRFGRCALRLFSGISCRKPFIQSKGVSCSQSANHSWGTGVKLC